MMKHLHMLIHGKENQFGKSEVPDCKRTEVLSPLHQEQNQRNNHQYNTAFTNSMYVAQYCVLSIL
jgi:hypothetical protein